MKKIYSTVMVALLFAMSLCFASCGPSTSDIEETTKQIIVDKVKEAGSTLVIKDLTLVKESDNKYDGIATCTLDGEDIELDVDVTCDGDNVIASWQPIGF